MVVWAWSSPQPTHQNSAPIWYRAPYGLHHTTLASARIGALKSSERMSKAIRVPFWRLSVASKHTPPPLIFTARLLIGFWSNFSWSTILYVIWKSLCSRGNLLFQNIVVSFSRGYYSSALLPKQTSCQTSQADVDCFCTCIAAYCQDLSTGIRVRNQTLRVKALTGRAKKPSMQLGCGPFQQRVGHTGFGKPARA